jgi:hypothetical protein
MCRDAMHRVSTEEKYFHAIALLTAPSGASCYHVRSVSHGRFMKKIGAVSSEELEEITACVQNCVEL